MGLNDETTYVMVITGKYSFTNVWADINLLNYCLRNSETKKLCEICMYRVAHCNSSRKIQSFCPQFGEEALKN